MLRLIRGLTAGLLAATGLGASGASAAAPAFMPAGGRTSQPVGHYEFCASNPAECRADAPVDGPVHLSRRMWSTIIAVNNRVNEAVTPRTDLEMWGQEELWSYPSNQGDCEDYVLEKQRELVAAGVPKGNLLITVVRQRNGDGHAVLTVRTDLGDYVLDNMEPRVLAWNETGYRFLKRQSEHNPALWVSIGGGQPVAVGSVPQD